MKRKASGLSLSDLEFVAQWTNIATISRIETGKTLPNVETLLLYHLLFDAPLTTLLEKYRENLVSHLKERLPVLLTHLKAQEPNDRVLHRIRHVEETVTRLAAFV